MTNLRPQTLANAGKLLWKRQASKWCRWHIMAAVMPMELPVAMMSPLPPPRRRWRRPRPCRRTEATAAHAAAAEAKLSAVIRPLPRHRPCNQPQAMAAVQTGQPLPQAISRHPSLSRVSTSVPSSLHPSLHPSLRPSVRPSICPSIPPSFRPSVPLSLSLLFSPSSSPSLSFNRRARATRQLS